MLNPLLYKNVIEVRKEVPGTAHCPLKVLTSDIEEYYSKTPKDQSPELSIIKEFLCTYLLQCWNLKTPEIVALLIDPSIINIKLSPHHKKNYFSRTCFGSKILEPILELNAITSISNKYEYNKFSNPVDLLKIGLFDIWVANDDRKPSNTNILLKEGENGFILYAIDHAFTFSSMSFVDLNPSFEPEAPYNDSILDTSLAQEIIKIALKEDIHLLKYINEYFDSAVSICHENFLYITDNIPKDLGLSSQCISALERFLFSKSRNKLVFTEFCRRFIL